MVQRVEVLVKNKYWGPVLMPKLTGPIQHVVGEHKTDHYQRSNDELLLTVGHLGSLLWRSSLPPLSLAWAHQIGGRRKPVCGVIWESPRPEKAWGWFKCRASVLCAARLG